MANATSNETSIKPGQQCLFGERTYQYYALIPAMFIIIILAFLNKRVRFKTQIWGGRPGLVIPMNFFGDYTSNHLSIAVAFGVLASGCFQLFNDTFKIEETNLEDIFVANNPWMKALKKVALVLLYGIINFPVLSCLTASNQLIGSILGLLYILMKFIVKMVSILSCHLMINKDLYQDDTLPDKPIFFQYTQVFLELPSVLCMVFLIVRFAMILCREIRKRRMMQYHHFESQSREDRTIIKVAEKHHLIHVDLLFKDQLDDKSDQSHPTVWYIRLRDAMYKTRPDFKYSTELICTLVVGAFIIYHIAIYFLIAFAQFIAYFDKIPMASWKADLRLYMTDSFYTSLAISCTVLILMMLHFMKCHRNQVLRIYRRTLSTNKPSVLARRSLSYPGYQVASIAFGFLVMWAIMFIVFFIVIVVISNITEHILEQLFLTLLPYIVIPLVTMLFQYLLGWIVFRDNQFPDVTFNIDNQRLYSIVSYFLFFFNILVGFYSSLFRILKSLALGTFFLSRLDRTPLMAGYFKWDKGYLAYIGFLNKLKASSHPVMLVFCHLLVNRSISTGHYLESFVGSRGPSSAQTSSPVYQQRRLANRWLVAYTLLRNPGLTSLRKQNLGIECPNELVVDLEVLQSKGLGTQLEDV